MHTTERQYINEIEKQTKLYVSMTPFNKQQMTPVHITGILLGAVLEKGRLLLDLDGHM